MYVNVILQISSNLFLATPIPLFYDDVIHRLHSIVMTSHIHTCTVINLICFLQIVYEFQIRMKKTDSSRVKPSNFNSPTHLCVNVCYHCVYSTVIPRYKSQMSKNIVNNNSFISDVRGFCSRRWGKQWATPSRHLLIKICLALMFFLLIKRTVQVNLCCRVRVAKAGKSLNRFTSISILAYYM